MRTAHRRGPRRLLAGLTVSALTLLWLPVSSLGDLHRDLSSRSATASQLRAAIAAETRRIGATSAGVREARVRLSELQARVDANEARVDAVQHSLIAARDRLTRLENRLHQATTLLAANLVATARSTSRSRGCRSFAASSAHL